MKRRIALGFLVAIPILLALVGAVGVGSVLAELQQADGWLVGAALLAAAGGLFVRAFVWASLLRLVDAQARYRRLMLVYLVATLAKNVVPFGPVTAEPVIAYLVTTHTDMRYEDGLASIVVADLLNYLPYYTLGGVGVLYLLLRAPVEPGLGGYLLGLGAGAAAILGLAALILYRRATVERLALGAGAAVERTLGRLSATVGERVTADRIRASVAAFYETIDQVADERTILLGAFAFAHVGTALLVASLFLVALALGHAIALPLVALVAAIGKLGILVPTPGGVGGVEATVAAVLVLVAGIALAPAATIALLYRVGIYWLPIALGLGAYGVLASRGRPPVEGVPTSGGS